MIIKLGSKSQALLKEMLSKNSRYGSVNDVLNEALAMFYCSDRKRGFLIVKVDLTLCLIVRYASNREQDSFFGLIFCRF